MKKLFVAAAVFCFVGAADCGGAPETPTFSTLRTDIFEPRCGLATGCHSENNPASGLDLKTDPYTALVDVATRVDPAKKYVVPGEPESSLLLTILREGTTGVRQMPPGAPLPAETLDGIEAWIAAGAPND